MGPQRKMSSSFKRGSLKSSTSGSQKVSELYWVTCRHRDRRTEGLWSPALPCGSAGQWAPVLRRLWGWGVVPSELRLSASFSEDGPPFLPL